jgi:hypothetical protein
MISSMAVPLKVAIFRSSHGCLVRRAKIAYLLRKTLIDPSFLHILKRTTEQLDQITYYRLLGGAQLALCGGRQQFLGTPLTATIYA